MNIFLITLLIYAGVGTWIGLDNSWRKKNPIGISKWFQPLGAFVWADLIILGPFWIMVSLLLLWTKDINLATIIFLIFWLVRAYGEVQYWIAEQFGSNKRNKPQDLWGNHFFGGGESVYFGYQVFWQMVMIVCAVALIKIIV